MESYCGASMTFQTVHSFVDLLPESWLQFPNLHKPGDHAALLMFRKLNSKISNWKWLLSLWAVQISLSQTCWKMPGSYLPSQKAIPISLVGFRMGSANS